MAHDSVEFNPCGLFRLQVQFKMFPVKSLSDMGESAGASWVRENLPRMFYRVIDNHLGIMIR